jgi:hypothetical protein
MTRKNNICILKVLLFYFHRGHRGTRESYKVLRPAFIQNMCSK